MTDTRRSSHALSTARLLTLPPDVVREFAAYLPIECVCATASTCRTLWQFFDNAHAFWLDRMVNSGYLPAPPTQIPSTSTHDVHASFSPASSLVPPMLAASVLNEYLTTAQQAERGCWNPTETLSEFAARLVSSSSGQAQQRGQAQCSVMDWARTFCSFSAETDEDDDNEDDADDPEPSWAAAAATTDGEGTPYIQMFMPRPKSFSSSPTGGLTLRQVAVRLHRAFSSCRATPLSAMLSRQNTRGAPPLLDVIGVPNREGSDMVTLSDGHSIFMRSGFCDDLLAYTFSYKARAARVYVPEVLVKPHLMAEVPVLPQHVITYGHRFSLMSDDDRVVQYGGCTEGGYRGMVSMLSVSWGLQRDFTSPGGRLARMPSDSKLGGLAAYEGVFTRRHMSASHRHLLRSVAFEIYAPLFPPRAYHAQATDVARTHLYLFGGLREDGTVDNMFLIIDLVKLRAVVDRAAVNMDGVIHNLNLNVRATSEDRNRWHQLRETAWREFVVGNEAVPLATIRPRFGHSMVNVGDQLYIAGGYTGSGMFRLYDGVDLTDIHQYCVNTGVCRELVPAVRSIPGFLGRCHSGTAFGPYIAYFGGTSSYSRTLILFDTRDFTIRKHRNGIDTPPNCAVGNTDRTPHLLPRVAHSAALSGAFLAVCGGCSFDRSIMNEFVVDLAPRPGIAVSKLTVRSIHDYRGTHLASADHDPQLVTPHSSSDDDEGDDDVDGSSDAGRDVSPQAHGMDEEESGHSHSHEDEPDDEDL